jgi:hypothetical protein
MPLERPATTPHRRLAPIMAAILAVLPSAALGQGLPAWRPMNPVLAARSALGFEPLTPAGRGWQVGLQLDHANILEFQTRALGELLLDAEVTRADLRVGRSLGRRWFVAGVVPFEGVEDGFLDPFVDWWHGLIGFREARRAERPRNSFEYDLKLPDGSTIVRARSGLRLGDVRATVGYRLAPAWQAAVTVALPTGPGADGYGLDAVGVGLSTTYRSRVLSDRLTYEGSAGVGYTPKGGELSRWQRTWFASATSGLRLRVVGQQSVYANLLYHSPGYSRTTLPSLDGADFSIDSGFLLRPGAGGPEIVAGLVEDLYTFGPAVDLVFRLGVRW